MNNEGIVIAGPRLAASPLRPDGFPRGARELTWRALRRIAMGRRASGASSPTPAEAATRGRVSTHGLLFFA